MVQGPNDLEALKATTPPLLQPASQRSKQNNPQAVPLTQEPDTVQLSANAVQAAARVRVTAPLPVQGTPEVVNTVPAGGTLRPAFENAAANPVQAPNGGKAVNPVVASNAAAAALANEPEVRTDQVEVAVKNLAALSGNSAAQNAKLAQNLLTGI